MPGALAGARQGGVLGQESVAGVNRVDALFFRQRDDAIDVEIGLHRALAFADQVGFVRLEAMQAEPVFLRVDGDRAQPELIGGAQDTDGDFAAIEGQEFFHVGRNCLAWITYQASMGSDHDLPLPDGLCYESEGVNRAATTGSGSSPRWLRTLSRIAVLPETYPTADKVVRCHRYSSCASRPFSWPRLPFGSAPSGSV